MGSQATAQVHDEGAAADVEEDADRDLGRRRERSRRGVVVPISLGRRVLSPRLATAAAETGRVESAS